MQVTVEVKISQETPDNKLNLRQRLETENFQLFA